MLDSSTDRTPDIVEGPSKDAQNASGRYGIYKKFRASMAKYRWILVWDADFVLQDGAASMIKELLGSLDERKYYLIYWPHIFLDGDLQHQNPKNPLHVEHWLSTWSPKLRYEKVGLSNSLIAPLTYYSVVYVENHFLIAKVYPYC